MAIEGVKIGEIGVDEPVRRAVIEATSIARLRYLRVDWIALDGLFDRQRVELCPCPDIEVSDGGGEEFAIDEAIILSLESVIEVADEFAYLKLLRYTTHGVLHLRAHGLLSEGEHSSVVLILHP